MKFNITITPLQVVVLLLSIIFLAFVMAYCKDRGKLSNLYDEALIQQKNENYQRAIDIFKEIGIKYEGTRKAELAIIKAAEIYFYNINNFRLAVDLLEKIIPVSKYPDYLIQEKLLLAEIYIKEADKVQEALELLSSLEGINIPEDQQYKICVMIADASRKMGEYEKAIEHYKKALELVQDKKEEFEILDNLGLCYMTIFERPEAEKIFKRILERDDITDEQRSRIEWQLFQNLDEQDRLDEALDILNRMLRRDPGNPLLYEEKKRIQEELKFYLKARRSY